MIQQACELPKATDGAKVERIKKLSVLQRSVRNANVPERTLPKFFSDFPSFASSSLSFSSEDVQKQRRRAEKDRSKDRKSSRRDWKD